jgi:serine protease inhibitor
MRRLILTTLITVACFVITGCESEKCICADGGPRALTAAEQRLVTDFNRFGFKLLRQVAQEEPDSNVFISPISVSFALGMTLNGAASTTEQAMKTTLEFTDLDMEEINRSYQSLMELLISLDTRVEFQIANSIWYRLGEHPLETFLETCSSYFGSEVSALDFSSPDAAPTINAWVEDKTQGRIDEIVDAPIPKDTVMFLINALYFLGRWTYQFDSDLTRDAWFELGDGSFARCRMMQRPGDDEISEYSLYEDDVIQVVDLPYGDGLFSMAVVLPHIGVDIDSLIAELDQSTWDDYMDNLHTGDGRLHLPKFEIEYGSELKDALTALGMGAAFTPGVADFSRMFEEHVWVDKVRHKTFVKVDEAGTEAAATTMVEIVKSAEPGYFDMYVDRPFIFAIREHHSGTIVFIGKIVDPGYQN